MNSRSEGSGTVLEHFAAVLPEMLEDVRRLVECESPSADLEAVAASASLVAEIGTRLIGVEPETLVIGGCTHLRWRRGSGERRVLLLAHHDTVWSVGSLATHPYGVDDDGILRGPGCFDMLVGLVSALHVLARLDPELPVTLLVTGDEEIGSTTSRALIEAEARECVAALVLEASADGGRLKVRRKGTSWYQLKVRGRAAHAGLEPERGVNAGVELAHQILALVELGSGAAGTTVVPTVLGGGTTANTVPAAAEVSVDVRAWTRGEQERVDRAIRALRPVHPEAELTVEGEPNRPPLDLDASTDLYRRAELLAERWGIGLIEGAEVGGGSDGNFTAGIGVPTLDGLGAVGGGAHADHEHVIIAAVPARTALLYALVDDLVHDPAGRKGCVRRDPGPP